VDIYGDKELCPQYSKMINRIGDYKSGRPFSYVDAKTGQTITDQNELEWIKSLRIPPAYNDVVISSLSNKTGKILAWGYDSKGRKQYIYNPKFVEKRSRDKYNKMIELKDVFVEIKQAIETDLVCKDSKRQDIAIILFLIIYCGFRVGNKCYEKANGSYGITTIKFSHIKFKKGVVIIDFIGKKGVRNTSQCDDPVIVKLLKKKMKAWRNAGAQGLVEDGGGSEVFKGISSHDVNAYLKKFHLDITSKDLRTWNANSMFITYATELAAEGVKNPVKRALEKVSQKLHNTIAVCKKNYVDPMIVDYIDRKIKNDI
jgi:DNA topoisomerase-1